RKVVQQYPWLYERPTCLAGGRKQTGAIAADLERGLFSPSRARRTMPLRNLSAPGSLKPLREGTGEPMPRFVLPGLLAATLVLLGIDAATPQEITIGMAGSITGSYPVLGEQMRRGAAMAVADINAKGGVLGKKLALEIADDACDPKQVVAAANQLVEKK